MTTTFSTMDLTVNTARINNVKRRSLLLLCAIKRRKLFLPVEVAYNIDVMLNALIPTASQLEQARREALRPIVLDPVMSGRTGPRAQRMMALANKGRS